MQNDQSVKPCRGIVMQNVLPVGALVIATAALLPAMPRSSGIDGESAEKW